MNKEYCIDVREYPSNIFFYGVLDSTGSQRLRTTTTNSPSFAPRNKK